MRAEIVDHQLPDRGARLDRRAALVRLQDDVGHGKEIRPDARRILVDVERGEADPPVAQAGDQRFLVDDGAARDIDECALRAQGIEDLGPIAGMKDLKYLNILRNKISDVSLLRNLSSLEEVILGYNPLASLAVLQELPNLRELHL